MREDHAGDAGHRQRIDEAGDRASAATSRTIAGRISLQHGSVSSGEVQGGDHEVDGLDADERDDDAAEAVDQQVAPQQRGRRRSAR